MAKVGVVVVVLSCGACLLDPNTKWRVGFDCALTLTHFGFGGHHSLTLHFNYSLLILHGHWTPLLCDGPPFELLISFLATREYSFFLNFSPSSLIIRNPQLSCFVLLEGGAPLRTLDNLKGDL